MLAVVAEEWLTQVLVQHQAVLAAEVLVALQVLMEFLAHKILAVAEVVAAAVLPQEVVVMVVLVLLF
jgi:hypothetical protein